MQDFVGRVPCSLAAQILTCLHVRSSLNCSHRAMQSDSKFKETQLKSNPAFIIDFIYFPVVFIWFRQLTGKWM